MSLMPQLFCDILQWKHLILANSPSWFRRFGGLQNCGMGSELGVTNPVTNQKQYYKLARKATASIEQEKLPFRSCNVACKEVQKIFCGFLIASRQMFCVLSLSRNEKTTLNDPSLPSISFFNYPVLLCT